MGAGDCLCERSGIFQIHLRRCLFRLGTMLRIAAYHPYRSICRLARVYPSWASRVFRIGHLGSFNDLMLAGTLSGVEMGLEIARIPYHAGGVLAALRSLCRCEQYPYRHPHCPQFGPVRCSMRVSDAESSLSTVLATKRKISAGLPRLFLHLSASCTDSPIWIGSA